MMDRHTGMEDENVLIIGGGIAAAQAAFSLRQQGWGGGVEIVSQEPHLPYNRPPLSKAFLAGEISLDRLFFRPEELYQKNDIALRLDTTVSSIDTQARTISLEDGEQINFSRLILATGTWPRRLNLPGEDYPEIGYLRDIGDVQMMQERFAKDARLLIVGAGYIGLEVAAVAAKHGLKVCVVELADRVMSRVAGTTISGFLENLHKEHGVTFRFNTGADGFEKKDGELRTVLSDGSAVPANIVLIGAGAIPNDDLARDAGIAVQDGVIVDEFTRTDHDGVYAIGDCTRHPSRFIDGPMRLESVHNALEQAKTAAAAICGKLKPYDQAPWFWSDQYDIKLQTVGISSQPYDREVVRGDIEQKKFSVFYRQGEKVIAVDSVNAPTDHMVARRLVGGDILLDDAQLTDPGFDLKSVLR